MEIVYWVERFGLWTKLSCVLELDSLTLGYLEIDSI